MSENAHDLLRETIITIDRQLGRSYAKQHPSLVESVMNAELRLREQRNAVCDHCQSSMQEAGEKGE